MSAGTPKPERVGIRQLRQNLSVYVRRVREEGRAYEVTERGEPVARLTPLGRSAAAASPAQGQVAVSDPAGDARRGVVVSETPRPVYIDASALVELIIGEPETPALRSFLAAGLSLVSSRIAAIEVRRVVSRQDELDTDEQVQSLLEGVVFVEPDPKIAHAAATAAPPSLRTLDAIHLASAQSVADEVTTVITYDHRLADAARAAGLKVVAPA